MSAREKVLYFDTFHELIAAAKQYRKLGVPCTINSWEQVEKNTLRILDDDEWWKHWEADIE